MDDGERGRGEVAHGCREGVLDLCAGYGGIDGGYIGRGEVVVG